MTENSKLEKLEKWKGALNKCIRCGYCYEHCPIYKSTRWEIDSPRGKLILLYGLPGVLADPQVRVYSDQTIVAENDNWADTGEMELAVRQSGAYPFAHGSRDAALIVTLPPGTYTAIGSGVGNTTGNALVEVYELP